MWNNYLKIAWRNLVNGRLYSAINVFGLSIGTAVCLLILLYVVNEWSFDQFHAKADRTYRMWVKEHFRGEVFFNTVTPILMGSELRDNFPEVEQMTRYVTGNYVLRKDNLTEQENIHFADPNFFTVFDFTLLKGKRNAVLSKPNAAVITEAMGLKYFGDPAPLGQTLAVQIGDAWQDFEITGIIEKAPSNSSIQYELILPFEVYKNLISERGQRCWTCVYVETYAVLRSGTTGTEMQAKAAPFFDGKVSEDYKPGEYEVGFQPLADIHLNKAMPTGIAPVSDSRYPYILSGIAALILLLAGINFVTLAVGRALTRSKEVGVRKTAGATRWQLMAQFWSEALLTASMAVILGVALAQVSLPWFNQLTGLSLSLAPTPLLLGTIVALAAGTGLLAGIYPALVLSGFSPLNSLRGLSANAGWQRHTVLRGLVGFQFLLSVMFIIATLAMQRQMHFLQNKNLGFRREGTLVAPFNSPKRLSEAITDSRKTVQLLQGALAGNPSVKEVSTANHTLGTAGWSTVGYTEPGTEKYRTFFINGIDEHFMPAMGVELAAGANFSKDQGSLAQSVVVNESFAKAYALENPVGQSLPAPFQAFKIVGVARDFHFASLHEKIQPLVLANDPIAIIRIASDQSSIDSPSPKFIFHISAEQVPATVALIRQAWKTILPDQPFRFSFVEDDLDTMYRAEARLSSLVRVGAFLAIFIACLGLLGISTLTISRRTKEIGIRKVLGASTAGLVRLLSGEFVRLALVALLLAAPVAWWTMNAWLEDFAYRVQLPWWVFFLAGIVAAGTALITVSFQSIRAALANPVDALRND